MSSTSSWQHVDTTLHFIHNHWNVYLPTPSFVDFCWIWPDDRTIINWPITFIAITTPMTRPCVNVVLDGIIWTNVLSVNPAFWMNKQQASDRMGCRSITVSDTNNYQFPSWLIQPHILFHPFVPIISNKNYKLLLKF
jgi:hypothetical protein